MEDVREEPLPPRSGASHADTDAATAQFFRGPCPEDTWEAHTLNDLRGELETTYTQKAREDAWKHFQGEVEIYYETLLKRWQKEMDNLLVFGGLFAAVLTPFNVEAYTSLQPDPMDASLAILQQISAQLNSFSVNSGFVNSTTPSLPLTDIQPAFHPSDSAVLINKLWFSSLICTLASTSIALILKQWLYDLSAGLTGTSREVARRRQYRYNALEKWHVGGIVLVPSLLLQAALILFLSGLLVLLWTLHSGVAILSSVLAGALFLFLTIATILPIFFSDCCYGSAQTKILYPIASRILGQISGPLLYLLQSRIPESRSAGKRLILLYNMVKSGAIRSPTWRSREERPVLNAGRSLDCSTAVLAFTTTFDEHYFKYLPVVLQDLPGTELADAFNSIVNAHWWQSQSTAEISYLEQQQQVLGRPLIRALGCLLTDPQFVINDRHPDAEMVGERGYHLAPICASLLRLFGVTESTDKNGLLEVLAPALGLKDKEVTQLAYKILLDVLDLWDTGDRLSYMSIRYALEALEGGIAQWDNLETMNYHSAIIHQLRTVRGIILCVLEALSANTSLSLDEARIVCDHAHRLLSIFVDHWSSIGPHEWQLLLGEKSPPHPSLLRDLSQYLWPPLLTLADDRRSCIVVPERMMETLKTALSAWWSTQDGRSGAASAQDGSPISPYYHMAKYKVQYVELGLKKSSHLLQEVKDEPTMPKSSA